MCYQLRADVGNYLPICVQYGGAASTRLCVGLAELQQERRPINTAYQHIAAMNQKFFSRKNRWHKAKHKGAQ